MTKSTNVTFTGSYGCVLLVDETITKQARKLNRKFSRHNEIDLKKNIPHISLYHAEFKRLPAKQVNDFLDAAARLAPSMVALQHLRVFSDKFLFWDVPSTVELRRLHGLALLLSAHANLAVAAASVKENLTLSPREKDNVRRYGYPLVQKLWRPHITLGYFPDNHKPVNDIVLCQGKIVSVAFAKMGPKGVVKKIIAQRYV